MIHIKPAKNCQEENQFFSEGKKGITKQSGKKNFLSLNENIEDWG